MRSILILVQVLVFVLALAFLIQNHGQPVAINLLGFVTYPQVDLLVVILVSLTAGAVLTWVLMTFVMIQSRSDLRQLKKKNRQLQSELQNLRNISIDEIPDDDLPQLAAPVQEATMVEKAEKGSTDV